MAGAPLHPPFPRPLSTEAVVAALEPLVTPERSRRMRTVLATRTSQVAFVFERMIDPHNLSAALRSLDAFSFQAVHLVHPGDRLEGEKVGISRGITIGTDRWLSLEIAEDTPACFAELRAQGYRVLASHLGEAPEAEEEGEAGEEPEAQEGSEYGEESREMGDISAKPAMTLAEIDFSQPTALVFGNEHLGVSAEVLAEADGFFRIPMFGFAQSLNLSVAVAVSAYQAQQELARLAREAGDEARFALAESVQTALLARWLRQSVRNAEQILAEVAIKAANNTAT